MEFQREVVECGRFVGLWQYVLCRLWGFFFKRRLSFSEDFEMIYFCLDVILGFWNYLVCFVFVSGFKDV